MNDVTKPRKILVADDDPIILDLVERALKSAGYCVLCVPSGEQALEVAATHEIDLALLDYRMPGLTGLDVGKAIFQLTARRFVLMSLQADQHVIEQAAAVGALGFLGKPLIVKEVVAQVAIGLQRTAEYDALTSSVTDLKTSQDNAIAQAVASARSVNTAVGILMERLQKSRYDAQKHLVLTARSQRRRLVEVSEEIIAAREKFYEMDQSRRPDDASGTSG